MKNSTISAGQGRIGESSSPVTFDLAFECPKQLIQAEGAGLDEGNRRDSSRSHQRRLAEDVCDFGEATSNCLVQLGQLTLTEFGTNSIQPHTTEVGYRSTKELECVADVQDVLGATVNGSATG